MDSAIAGLAGAAGSVAFFAYLAFATWIEYRKKKDERDAAHLERMKAMELGYAPADGEIERAKAYASAAQAAGLIGLLVPLALVLLTFIGTLVALLNRRPEDNITVPLIIAWSIAGVVSLATAARSLSVIRQIPKPDADAAPRGTPLVGQDAAASARFRADHPKP